MISRELTNIYLADFDLLTEALYVCWSNSFCYETNTLDKSKLKEQICSYGFYDHKYAIKKEVAINFTNKIQFKTIAWANEYSNAINANARCEYFELYKQVINEIENNLFFLTNKADKIAYANILLRDLDKNYIHKQDLTVAERDLKYMEIFRLVLNRKFILNHKTTVLDDKFCDIHTNYDLTVQLINHLDFIDKLIELFFCFGIDLIILAKKASYNLYIFDEGSKYHENIHEAKKSHTNLPLKNTDSFIDKVLPKFNSPLPDDCLVKIMNYLSNKNKLSNPNIDTWLFWFNRKCIKFPEFLKWNDSPTLLSNLIQHLCGESISLTVKTAFNTTVHVKPTKCKYERSRIYKEIEQIITISKQKNC